MFDLLGFICTGDKTSCGGTVVTGSLASTVNGRPIARVNDRIACRRSCVIISGNPSEIIDGAPVAVHGSLTSGNCTCLSQNNNVTGDSQSQEAAAAVPSAADSGLAFMPDTAALMSEDHFVEFRLLNNDGDPFVGSLYTVTDAAGNKVSGTLDTAGYAKVAPVKPGACRVEFPELGYSATAESCQQ